MEQKTEDKDNTKRFIYFFFYTQLKYIAINLLRGQFDCQSALTPQLKTQFIHIPIFRVAELASTILLS